MPEPMKDCWKHWFPPNITYKMSLMEENHHPVFLLNFYLWQNLNLKKKYLKKEGKEPDIEHFATHYKEHNCCQNWLAIEGDKNDWDP